MRRETIIGVCVTAAIVVAAMYFGQWIYQRGLDDGMAIAGKPSPGVILKGADIAEADNCTITVTARK